MGKSIFENFSDEQLIKYLKYLYSKIDLVDDYAHDLEGFYSAIQDGGKESTIILAPLKNKKLTRLDVEYLYELFMNNSLDSLDERGLEKPSLTSENVSFVVEERRWVSVYYEDNLDTYSEFTTDYLYQLKENNEIDPWDWNIVDEDIRDSDTDDWYFEF